MTHTIVMAGQSYEVEAPPLGKLKKIVSSINRVAKNANDVDVMMEEAVFSIGLLIGKTPQEMEEMRVGYRELVEAFNLVPGICGLVEKEHASGEAVPG